MMMLFFYLWTLWLPGSTPERILTIHFENIRYAEGVMFVGVYKDGESWDRKLPMKEINFAKASLIDGKLTVELGDLEPGTYALAVLDDANANNHVDIGFIFPKEGFGFSNYHHNSMFLPVFEDFAFSFPEQRNVTVRMRYLDF